MKIEYTDGFKKDVQRLFSNNPIYSIPRFIDNVYYSIKYAFQRVIRGYDDRMIFNFHSEFTEMAIDILEKFRENKMTHPFEFKSVREWVAVIDEIINGFKAARRLDRVWNVDKKKDDSDREVFANGMNLFHKYFFNLWD